MIRPSISAGLVVARRFRLDFPIGEGGFGAVWRATELDTGRHVALKILKGSLDSAGLTRFEREAQALARLDHPGCVRLLAFGYADEVAGPYLVTEYIAGDSLGSWARQPHSVETIVRVGAQIASVLEQAHRQGITHRDLKPTNVLVTPGPDGPVVKVLDFGIARLSGAQWADVTKTGEVIGTPGYMSPEQLRGERDVGPPTDAYCLGALLYFLLEGRPVFEGPTALAIAMQHLVDAPAPLTRPVPPQLGKLVMGLLAKDPRARPSARQALGELHAVVGEQDPVAAHLPARRDEPRPRGRARVAWAVAGLGAGVLLGYLVWPREEPRPRPIVPRALVSTPPPRPPKAAPPPKTAAKEPVPAPPPSARSYGCDAKVPARAGVGREFEVEVEDPFLPGVMTKQLHQLPSYLPRGYDPRRPHPALIILDSDPRYDATLGSLYTSFADEHGVVLFRRAAPQEEAAGRRWKAAQVADALAAFGKLSRAVCIDLNAVFVVGHEGGGRGAELLACRAQPPIAGVITRGFRLDARERRCVPPAPIPHLGVFLTGYPHNPPEGGTSPTRRSKGTFVASIDGQEQQNLAINECTEPQTETRYGAHVCRSWSCAAPTVSCRVAGGPRWGDFPPDFPVTRDYPAAAKDFPYEEILWDFIVTVRPALAHAPPPGDGFEPDLGAP